ncbi:MAG: mevalonate kinase [Saprospiraceae bacterium]
MLGEHTVLHGSAAYAVPLRRFSARIDVRNPEAGQHQLPTGEGIHASFDFEKWVAFAKTSETLANALDFQRWESEAAQLGVFADIPIGYGLGSSGAITAAAYVRYVIEPATDLSVLRAQLAAMECFFHGKSSGLDPLVSYLNKAVYISPTGSIEPVEVDHAFPSFEEEGGWFLVDSGQPRAGKDAISRFGESCKDDRWRSEVLAPMTELVEQLAVGMKTQTFTGLSPKLKELSKLQLCELGFLIPSHIAALWSEWLQNGSAYLKLCGAGGGGFFLGYAPIRSEIKLEVIWL